MSFNRWMLHKPQSIHTGALPSSNKESTIDTYTQQPGWISRGFAERRKPTPKDYILSDSIHSFIHSFIHSKFIYFETETVRVGEGQREREGDREPQASSALPGQSLMRASDSQIVRSRPELKPRIGRLTDWAIQVPLSLHLYNAFWNDKF